LLVDVVVLVLPQDNRSATTAIRLIILSFMIRGFNYKMKFIAA
jgi:hypothetical protein